MQQSCQLLLFYLIRTGAEPLYPAMPERQIRGNFKILIFSYQKRKLKKLLFTCHRIIYFWIAFDPLWLDFWPRCQFSTGPLKIPSLTARKRRNNTIKIQSKARYNLELHRAQCTWASIHLEQIKNSNSPYERDIRVWTGAAQFHP